MSYDSKSHAIDVICASPVLGSADLPAVEAALQHAYEMGKAGIGVPVGYANRLAFIEKTSIELIEMFHKGNKKDFLARLEELPLRVAVAVVATVQVGGSTNVARYLREMA